MDILAPADGDTVDAPVTVRLAATGVEVTLFASGAVFAASLWLGPGGSRVRAPLGRVVNPLSVEVTSWFAAVLVVAAAGLFLGYLAADGGVSWVPDDGPPLSSLSPR